MTTRPLEIGDHVDRFEIVAVLGSGARSTVYRVRHRAIGAEYALKLLSEPSGEDRARLLREARAQATVRHPNLVPVLDVLTSGDDLGLLLELVDGPDLAGWLVDRVPTVATLDRLAEGLFAGLGEAHAHGLIHRDLKPSNVLIDGPDEAPVPRIIDFGLVKAHDGEPSLTRTGWLLGSPAYAAPEQAGGARNVDARADLFGLAAVLYEVATGHRAFPGTDVVTVLQAAVDERYVDPRELRTDLPERIVAAIEGGLRAEPVDRWPDVAAFRAAWRGEEGLRVPPLVQTSSAGPIAVDRGRLWPWAVLLVFLVGFGGMAVATWRRDEVAPDAETPPTGVTPPTASAAAVPAPPPSAPPAQLPRPQTEQRRPPRVSTQHASVPPVASRPLPTITEADARGVSETPQAQVPAAEPRAWIAVSGDAAEVVLVADGGEIVQAGAVAPGPYVVEARFERDERRVEALRLALGATEAVEVRCSVGFRRCTPHPSMQAPR